MKEIKKSLITLAAILMVVALSPPAFAPPPGTETSPPGTYTTPTPPVHITNEPRREGTDDKGLLPGGVLAVDVLKAPVPLLTEEYDKLEIANVTTFEDWLARYFGPGCCGDSSTTCGQVGDTGCADQHPPGSGTVKPEPQGGAHTDRGPGMICPPLDPGCGDQHPPADKSGSTGEQGKIIGGEWVGDSKSNHPDFLWLPSGKTAAQMFRPGGKGGGLVIERLADGRFTIKRLEEPVRPPDRDTTAADRDPLPEPTKLEWPNLRITLSDPYPPEPPSSIPFAMGRQRLALDWNAPEPPSSSPPDPGRVRPDDAPPIMFRPGGKDGGFAWPEGTKIVKRDDGAEVGELPGGTVVVRHPKDDRLEIKLPGWPWVEVFRDGSMAMRGVLGLTIVQFPRGTGIIVRDGGWIIRFPDGSRVERQPGRAPVRYPPPEPPNPTDDYGAYGTPPSGAQLATPARTQGGAVATQGGAIEAKMLAGTGAGADAVASARSVNLEGLNLHFSIFNLFKDLWEELRKFWAEQWVRDMERVKAEMEQRQNK